MANTLYSDLNLTTSVAGFLANSFTTSGWQIYYHAIDLVSGVGYGPITIAPEMPNEAELIVMPPRPNRTPQEVVLPVFSVSLTQQPTEEIRLGLGDAEFKTRATLVIEGFVTDKGQHLAFATMMRNFFKPDIRIPIWNWEANPVTPALVDNINLYIERRRVDRFEFPDSPQTVRYYLNCQLDIVYFE